MGNISTLVYVMIFAVSLIFPGLLGRGLFTADPMAPGVDLFLPHVSEFNKVYAFSIGGGGGGSTPQHNSGGSSGLQSGKISTPMLNSGGSSGLPSGTSSSNKQPNCVSQSCTGSNDATKLNPTSNTGSKNPVQGGSANTNTSPKVVTNPNTAIITNPDVDVNENNVDVNVEGTNDGNSNDGNSETNNYYYYYPQANTVNSQDSTTNTASENPVVIYNNSIINPVMSVIKMVGANAGANTITGIEDGKAGQTLELIGTNNKNYVQIKNNVNVTLSKEPIDLGQDDSLTLSFNDNTGKWIETTHTDNSN